MVKDIDVASKAGSDRITWLRLIEDHERIADQCSTLTRLARQSSAQSAAASRQLIELAVTVAEHLRIEDEVIDRTAMALGTRYSADAIADMEEDLDILRSDWKSFIGRWLPVIAPSEWALFGAQAESMFDRLSDQVRLETDILYDHALGNGVVLTRRNLGGLVLH